MGLNHNPIVEYYVEDDAGITLPTFRKEGDQQAFLDDWKKRDTPYGYVDGDKIAFLIPKIDLPRVEQFGVNPTNLSYKNIDDMINYYEDIIKHYDEWVGLNDDINSVHYNVPQKYFTIADKNGFGLAYYSSNLMGSNNPSMYGYLVKGWLALHEVGHGYDGIMVNDEDMNLMEVENNILANQYQTTVMGIDNGWLYEGHQESTQRDIHNRIINANGTFKFGNIGYRERLDFMTKMVRLTGIDGFTEMWKGIREEEAAADKLHNPFIQDVPKWINTYWLADQGVNGTAYFDLYNIDLSQVLKDKLASYNNSFAYPLAMLIQDKAELERIKQKLHLATEYELVKSSDLADISIFSNAEITLNLNGQTLPENVKVSLLENGKEVAQATVKDGKAVFPHIRAGVYQIAAPLSLENALPRSQYLIVKEAGNNTATLDYPTYEGTQSNVTQQLSLRGLSNREFAFVDYDPDKKTIKFVENPGQPHFYFNDEYVHVKIEKADGTVVLDESLVGSKNLPYKVQEFNLDYGDKIIVRHREPAARRKVVRKETNQDLVFPYASNETVTYTLTDKGFIINDETEADANRRYSTAITSDVDKIADEIKANPNRNYRTQLFHVLQGTKFVNGAIKAELEGILQPLVEKYYVIEPIVNHIERGATTITGEGQLESTIIVTFPNQISSMVEVDTERKWKVDVPEGLILEHNDVTLIKAIGELGSVSNEVIGKVEDSISPEAPHINEIEAGANEIKGTSEPNSTVVITLPGGTIVEVETDNNGNWKLETNDKLSNGSTIEAAAKDLAGNVSEKVSIIVKDTIPPAPPTVNPLKSTDTELSGTAEPNSKITIKLNDRIVTVETNAAGQWKYILDEHTQLKGDTVVIVTATDKADNQSLNTEAIVENIITPIPDNAEKTPEAVEEPNESDEIEEDTWGLIDGKGNAEAIKNSNLDYEFNDTKTEESTDDCDIEETEKEESDKVVAPLPESEDKALEVPTDQTKDEESHESNGATVNRVGTKAGSKNLPVNTNNQQVQVEKVEKSYKYKKEVTHTIQPLPREEIVIDEPEIITVTSNPVHTEETVLKEKHPSTKSNIFGSKIGEVKEKLNNISVNSKPFIANEKIKNNQLHISNTIENNYSIYKPKKEDVVQSKLPMTGISNKDDISPLKGLVLISGLVLLGIATNRRKDEY
ncbi:Ig-like domain-containing protein [Staphylococcus carnosus]|uniref:Ig-like domain-containing protein n=1 Tax=Staphylococcus carnosus TaxID=1281 RepID=UPI0020A37303|nr:Ig-like domain-containing protein [Staphylococcus carnosus]UTB81678.1 hypothetical protein A2I65_12660 [Staphylococcus carnosus]